MIDGAHISTFLDSCYNKYVHRKITTEGVFDVLQNLKKRQTNHI